MAYTLVVIDMQPYFTSHTEAMNGVEAAIKRAKKSGRPIVFVEFSPESYGKTHEKLRKSTEKYSKTFFVKKHSAGGSLEINNAIKKHKLPERIRVCGVETGCCVRQSLLGIINNKMFRPENIALLTEATANHRCTEVSREHTISELKKLGVKII